MKKYMVNEIFYSVQGEGIRAGTPNVFVRFTGCNLQCRKEEGEKSPGGFDCDTEFASGVPMSSDEIFEQVNRICDPKCRNVIFTGGEPGLQLSVEILELFGGWFRCIETNGSVDLSELQSHLEWITVSPKVAEHAIRQLRASEVKYVRGYGQGIPRTSVVAEHRLISPAFDGDRPDYTAIQWCIDLVKKNPDWRISIQLHKGLRVR